MQLFGSDTREGILLLLLLDNFKGSIREVYRKVGATPSHVRKELKKLEEIGILKKEKIANFIFGTYKMYYSKQPALLL
jgi:DNA-binding Lrp family transcriptional regulator